MKRILFYTLLLATAHLRAQVPTDSVYSLDSCIALALEHNFDLRIQHERQLIADENATYGNAGGLPSVTLGAGGNGRNVSDYTTDAAGAYTTDLGQNVLGADAGINVSWTLFEGLKVLSTLDKLKELKTMGDLALRMKIEDVVADVSRVYYTIVRQQIRLRNLEATRRLSDERLQIVRQQFDLGDASRLDLLQAEVDYNNDNYACVKQQETLNAHCLTLNELMALDDLGAKITLAHDTIALLPLGSRTEMLDKVMTLNSEILTASSEVMVKAQDIKIINSRFFPSLKLNGGYGYDGTWYDIPPTHNNQRLTLNYGLTLSMNLFDGGSTYRAKRTAKRELTITQLEHERLQQRLESEVLNLWMAYENNQVLIDLERVSLASARSLYQSSLDRYRLEELSGIELRSAQNSLLQAEESLSQALYEAKMNEIALLLLSGEIVQSSTDPLVTDL